ncbi:hypothetical protein E2320_003764 [Naja naja]|nr:hypothetical protein E2320_003764 [Naja naja]
MALNKVQAAKTSNQSMAEIQKLNSPTTLCKTVAVHHDDVDHGEPNDEDEDIYQLKSSQGKGMATEKKQTARVGCGGNHL